MGKLTPSQVTALHRDLRRIEELDATIAVLNRIRSTPASAENFGGAINKALAGMGEPDALPASELGLAALDGIIAAVSLKRDEIETRTAPFVDRGAA